MKLKKQSVGRPIEGRVRINICILPVTFGKIKAAKNVKMNTLGKVVDARF